MLVGFTFICFCLFDQHQLPGGSYWLQQVHHMMSRISHRSPLVLLFSVIWLITLSGHTCLVNTAAHDDIPTLIKLNYSAGQPRVRLCLIPANVEER